VVVNIGIVSIDAEMASNLFDSAIKLWQYNRNLTKTAYVKIVMVDKTELFIA
jgi:hypothetical protein